MMCDNSKNERKGEQDSSDTKMLYVLETVTMWKRYEVGLGVEKVKMLRLSL